MLCDIAIHVGEVSQPQSSEVNRVVADEGLEGFEPSLLAHNCEARDNSVGSSTSHIVKEVLLSNRTIGRDGVGVYHTTDFQWKFTKVEAAIRLPARLLNHFVVGCCLSLVVESGRPFFLEGYGVCPVDGVDKLVWMNIRVAVCKDVFYIFLAKGEVNDLKR